jgi:lipoate-protein ligase B
MIPARFCQFSEPLSYPEAVLLQKRLVEERIADRIPDTILLLEHPPVITLGRRGRDHHLMASRDELRANGVEVHVSQRGGDVTFHGPGQWVLYPILKLGRGGMGAHGYLHALEEIAIRTASQAGIPAFRREGMAGGWAEQGKFAATGFAFRKWVSYHGLSINVKPDLRCFDLIVGCGLVGEKVTSFQEILGGDCPSMEKVAASIQGSCEKILERQLTSIRTEDLNR